MSEILLKEASDLRVFLLVGDLGTGKTSLTKFLVQNLGVVDQVSSPTFSIVNQYISEAHGPIYHFDLYRIKGIEELEDIGFFEYLDSGAYCFIEWPEIVHDYIVTPYTEIKMSILENNDRKVIISSSRKD